MQHRLSLLCVILCAFLACAANYGEVPSSSDLVSLWHLNGNATDDAGSNDGTVDGATSVSNGKLGGGYSFSSAGTNCIDVGSDSSLIISGAFTLSWWMNANSNSSAQNFVAQRDGTTRNWYCYTAVSSTELRCRGGLTADYITATVTYSVWQHVVVVFNSPSSGNGYIYLDGDDATIDGTHSTTETSSVSTYIGGRGDGAGGCTSGLYGIMDEVMIWDRALSASEVKKLYAMQKGMYGIVD